MDRIDQFISDNGSDGWLASFNISREKRLIDSVVQKIAISIRNQVLGGWSKIFEKPVGAKDIIVEWAIDASKNNNPFLTFSISDGAGIYSLRERSLGFRWFFCLLLFTAFRDGKGRKTLFLFDEPAANLHAKAQAQLLSHFAKIAQSGNQIIYSTHSHHMINPKWLSGTYIVENEVADLQSDDPFAFDVAEARLKATLYRSLVSQSATRSNYYRPILECLRYSTPEIALSGPCVVVEGITDFYAFRIFKNISQKTFQFNFVPGSGAGASGPIISLLLAQGERFLVLLDDDKQGRATRSRYREDWYLGAQDVVTLGDLDTSLTNKRLENLFSPESLNLISQKEGIDGKNKKQLGAFLAEVCATSTKTEFMSEHKTAAVFSLVFTRLDERLGAK